MKPSVPTRIDGDAATGTIPVPMGAFVSETIRKALCFAFFSKTLAMFESIFSSAPKGRQLIARGASPWNKRR